MIYLIGGSIRGGKSILSRKLSKKLNIPYISTDILKLVMMPYFKAKKKMFDLPPAIDKYFKNYTGQEMLNADIREAKSIWPGIKSLIQHLLVYEMDYIIEGVHLLPSLIKQFQDNKNIKTVFLVKSSEDKIFKGLLQNKNNGDWLVGNINDKETLSMAAKSLCDYGKYFNRETKQYGLKCINTEDDFLDKIKEASDYLRN